MKPNYILECCVDSVVSAIAAEKGGADRLELCANLIIGGTTPPLSLFQAVKKAVTIPVHVLLRPRFGDFCYDDYEKEMLLFDIRQFEKAGADGIVIGALRSDGTLDSDFLSQMLSCSGNMHRTLHRAFDMCRDGFEALHTAANLGFHTILTSGLSNTALEGINTLRALSSLAEEIGITIMAGSGIHADAIRTLSETTTICTFHMSGKMELDSSMKYRNPHVNMGIPGFSEYTVYQTSQTEIQKAKDVLLERTKSAKQFPIARKK